ncbi:flavodoxin family protein [Sneathiella sp. P13V-1]|uniref:NAD(P)H-dependent oxidoreductase n=1 Tax=Sneathiella sp. P13V-1 TaxID=2697366 RepID=UPI00187B7CD1|nr:NAD(P)H-dependent oxidoreductase [Sneathiella sp. P13V-1]MBE7637751.1 flavodoxin family protein [Sneathiella sp. P13V-1]
MKQKRIFILNGHPAEASLNRTLAETYATTAQSAGHEVRLIHLCDVSFDPDFGYGGFENTKPLEADLTRIMDNIDWCDHFVITTPMWWGSLPAKLKGFFDRAFLPGTAFNSRKRNWLGMPEPMLTGKTGHVLMTSDTPGWAMSWFYKNAMIRQIKDQILGFVGIKPVKFTHFTGASEPKEGLVNNWIAEVSRLGTNAA